MFGVFVSMLSIGFYGLLGLDGQLGCMGQSDLDGLGQFGLQPYHALLPIVRKD